MRFLIVYSASHIADILDFVPRGKILTSLKNVFSIYLMQ